MIAAEGRASPSGAFPGSGPSPARAGLAPGGPAPGAAHLDRVPAACHRRAPSGRKAASFRGFPRARAPRLGLLAPQHHRAENGEFPRFVPGF